MARLSKRFSKEDERELLGELCVALLQLKNIEHAVQFIIDLLSRQEIAMIAKRLKIAKLLLNGEMYKTIQHQVKVSMGTVAKVQRWLDEGGRGFRFIYQKSKYKNNPLARILRDDLESYKHRKMTWFDFLPAVLLEEMAISANQKQRKRLLKILEDMPKKEKVHRDLIALFQNPSSAHRHKTAKRFFL